MPREPRRRNGPAQRAKGNTARQTTLFSFLKQTSLNKDPTEVSDSGPPECTTMGDAPLSSSSATASADWIILDTPPASRPFAASSSSKRLTGRPALGPLVVPGIENVPGTLPVPVKLTPRQHKAPRRSSFLVRRHELATEKRLAEAMRTGQPMAPLSRDGNYDGLNYAPVEQNASSASPIQVAASQRARKMALAASGGLPAKRTRLNQVTSPQAVTDSMAASETASQGERSFVFEDDSPLILRKTPLPLLLPTAKLDTQELDTLDDILNEDPARRVLEPPRAYSLLPKSLSKPVNFPPGPAGSPKLPLDKENINLLDDLVHAPAVGVQSKNKQKDLPRSSNPSLLQTSVTRNSKGEKEAETTSPSLPQERSYMSDNSLIDAALSDWSGTSSDGLGVAVETLLPSQVFTNDRNWLRCQVHAVVPTKQALKLSLDVCGVRTGGKLKIEAELSGTWADTPVKVGDIVNLVPSYSSASTQAFNCQRLWRLSDSDTTQSEESQPPALFVLHPDLLLSGTTVVGSLTCPRRSVLQQFWASGGDCVQASETAPSGNSGSVTPTSPAGQVMLIGTVVHEVFQKLVCREDPVDESSALAAFRKSVLKQSVILQVYALALNVSDFCRELCVFTPHILKWIVQNPKRTKASALRTVCNKSRQVIPTLLDVLDIEENLWIPKLGVKGKIDMTVSCSLAGLNLSEESTNHPLMIPFELKTGRPSYSFEHIGQVLLYTLMLADRYRDQQNTSNAMDVGNCGWLVYLREPVDRQNRAIVRPSASSFRGLIDTRNRLAEAIQQVISLEKLRSSTWRPPLPPNIGQMRICSTCPQQLTCGLFLDKPAFGSAASEVENLLRSRCSHLSANHIDFFCLWSRLQLLEHAAATRLDNVVAGIVESGPPSTELTPPGCIRELVVEQTSRSTEPDSDDYIIRFKKNNGSPIQLKAFSVGDFVLVSSDNGRHVGLCLATISGYHGNETDATATTAAFALVDSNASLMISIRCDRKLPTWIRAFRLDRYISDKATQINLSNLVELMQDTPLSSRLRGLLIDRRPPRFTGSLPKRVILKSKFSWLMLFLIFYSD
uniref:DNA replication factor Dna2 N-terminal domain-containing protein n=1 Tax=Schistocephalus solidus TaxID=70667 RepID=A0A0X3PX29_SCHSO